MEQENEIEDCFGNFSKDNKVCTLLCGDSENCKIEALSKKKKKASLKAADVLKIVSAEPGIKFNQLLKKFNTLPKEQLRTDLINILAKKVDITNDGSIYPKNKN